MTVIGAGPTGLFGAFYAGLRELKTKIIEAMPEPGGQLTVLYPDKFIYDAPGFRKILAKDLVRNLLDQVSTFNPTIILNQSVHSINLVGGNIYQIETQKEVHFSRTILIASGIGAFIPNKLDVPGADMLEDRGIYYFASDKNLFRGKTVLIVGGGDSAVDWALTLDHWAKSVTLIHRRDVFRAHESSISSLMASNVQVKLFSELKEVYGTDRVTAVKIVNNKTKEDLTIPVDAVLVLIGFKADLGSMKQWGLTVEGRHIRVSADTQTNLKGVYAAGDIAAQEGATKLNLIATGFAQAASAANSAKRFIDPIAPAFEHSSERRL